MNEYLFGLAMNLILGLITIAIDYYRRKQIRSVGNTAKAADEKASGAVDEVAELKKQNTTLLEALGVSLADVAELRVEVEALRKQKNEEVRRNSRLEGRVAELSKSNAEHIRNLEQVAQQRAIRDRKIEELNQALEKVERAQVEYVELLGGQVNDLTIKLQAAEILKAEYEKIRQHLIEENQRLKEQNLLLRDNRNKLRDIMIEQNKNNSDGSMKLPDTGILHSLDKEIEDAIFNNPIDTLPTRDGLNHIAGNPSDSPD